MLPPGPQRWSLQPLVTRINVTKFHLYWCMPRPSSIVVQLFSFLIYLLPQDIIYKQTLIQNRNGLNILNSGYNELRMLGALKLLYNLHEIALELSKFI